MSDQYDGPELTRQIYLRDRKIAELKEELVTARARACGWRDRSAKMEAVLRRAIANELELDERGGSTWRILNDALDHGSVGQVGCEREDGTLNVHSANENCEVCSSLETDCEGHSAQILVAPNVRSLVGSAAPDADSQLKTGAKHE